MLFFLVFGMSATVDMRQLKKQLGNRTALLIGVTLQFIILPFLGFVVVKMLQMEAPMGIPLLVITSSPGGSYSNWWCSIFNADLALSVTMTTISTLLSMIMLPVNLIIYTNIAYSSNVVKSLDWSALFISLMVVIGGIFSGLICSANVKSLHFNMLANKLGNISGVLLVIFSVFVSSDDTGGGDVWNQRPMFYVGVAIPCLFGLLVANCIVSLYRLEKPERVAVAVECCYQNTGIATSVAAAVFEGNELAIAVGVPLFYGICEATVLALYCSICWKLGWTKAPPNDPLWTVISTSYEVKEMMQEEPESIEVVLGTGDSPTDLIFSSSKEGYKIDEVSLETLTSSAENGESGDLIIEDLDGTDEHDVQLNGLAGKKSKKSSQRKRGQYKTLETHSPIKGGFVDSLSEAARSLPKIQSNPVSNALSTLRGVRLKNGKYSKAVMEVEEIQDVPAADKQID